MVKRGLTYRASRGTLITRETMEHLNAVVTKTGFKVPALWDPDFLHSLACSKPSGQQDTIPQQIPLTALREELVKLTGLSAQKRGYAFEDYLRRLFDAFRMDPRPSFRLTGEQIDGSFQLDGETYLIEAKWQDPPTGHSDLLILQGKVEGGAGWTRGVFISYSGFSPDAVDAFSRGRTTRVIGMTGADINDILEGKMPLDKAIRGKARWAAETGQFYVSVYELSALAR